VSSIITPGTAADGKPLLSKPFDKFWDVPPTRREMQTAFNKLSQNQSELMGMCDTAALIINYLCEVALKVKREDIEIFVEAKKLQLKEMREKMQKDAQTAGANEQPNG